MVNAILVILTLALVLMLNTVGSYLRLHLLNSKLQMISIGEANMQKWGKSGTRAFPFTFHTSPLHLLAFTPSRNLPRPADHISSLDVSLTSRQIRSPKKFHPQKKIKKNQMSKMFRSSNFQCSVSCPQPQFHPPH